MSVVTCESPPSVTRVKRLWVVSCGPRTMCMQILFDVTSKNSLPLTLHQLDYSRVTASPEIFDGTLVTCGGILSIKNQDTSVTRITRSDGASNLSYARRDLEIENTYNLINKFTVKRILLFDCLFLLHFRCLFIKPNIPKSFLEWVVHDGHVKWRSERSRRDKMSKVQVL